MNIDDDKYIYVLNAVFQALYKYNPSCHIELGSDFNNEFRSFSPNTHNYFL